MRTRRCNCVCLKYIDLNTLFIVCNKKEYLVNNTLEVRKVNDVTKEGLGFHQLSAIVLFIPAVLTLLAYPLRFPLRER